MIFQSQQKTRLCLFRASSGRGKIFFFYHTPLFFGDFPILFFLFLSPENRRCLRCKLRACRIINIRNIAFIGRSVYISRRGSHPVKRQPVSVMEGMSPSVVLSVHLTDIVHPSLHTVKLLFQYGSIPAEQIDIPRNDTGRIAPCTGTFRRTEGRHHLRNHPSGNQLFLIQIVQIFSVKCIGIRQITCRTRKHLCVACPSHALISLRTVCRHI